MVGVVRDGLHVAQQALQNHILEDHLLGQRQRLAGAARDQAQKTLRRAGDGALQFIGVEPAYQVGRLVDGVRQLQEGGAVVEVLAAHRQDDIAALVRIEKMVQHPLDHQPRIVHRLVGGVKDFLELVQHKQHVRVGRVGPGRHVEFGAVGVQQARKAGLLAEDLGDVDDALLIGFFAAA